MKLKYPFVFEKIRARFLKRINRFVVRAELKNQEVLAYLPNPGRLWELLLPGRTLLLFRNNSASKIPYTVLACKKDSNFVLLHTHLTNKIIKKLIEEGKIEHLKDFRVLKEEVSLGSSRFDLLLERKDSSGKKILEIKTCTLFGKEIAMFPDAETKRGTRHILELRKIQKEGLEGEILFVVMNPQIKYFLPAYHIDYEFSKALIEAKGELEIKAITLKWDKTFTQVEEIRELQIPFDFLNKIEDKGAYLLVFELKAKEKIKIGSLGERIFEKGFYVYVGSGMKNLTKRVKRHLRKRKTLKWHIDFLLLKASNLKPVIIRSFERLECTIAKELSLISDKVISGFGASDCRCQSHLFYFSQNPLERENFQDLLVKYRIDRIKLE